MAVPPLALQEIEDSRKEEPKLGEWAATAICGNDILSSVLYVSGLVTTSAGEPVAAAVLLLLLVSAVLLVTALCND
jgi:hypothetical protein